MTMNKFYFSRTYTFEVPKVSRKHYFFNLVERFGGVASFCRNDKDETTTAAAEIVMDGDTETAKLLYRGYEYELRADRYIAKGYRLTPEGRMEKDDDRLRDAHLHTADNRSEIELSQWCHCICCQVSFKPEEVADYTDGGVTGICPNCGIDAIIADASGIRMTKVLLSKLNKKYF